MTPKTEAAGLGEPWRTLHKRLIVAAAGILAQRHWGEPINRNEAQDQDEALAMASVELRKIADAMAALATSEPAAPQAVPTMQIMGAGLRIPFSALNEEWALRNHRQSLATLASRGGLSACEALAIAKCRPWHRMDATQSLTELKALVSTQPVGERLPLSALAVQQIVTANWQQPYAMCRAIEAAHNIKALKEPT